MKQFPKDCLKFSHEEEDCECENCVFGYEPPESEDAAWSANLS
jgi:hypothetical protein